MDPLSSNNYYRDYAARRAVDQQREKQPEKKQKTVGSFSYTPPTSEKVDVEFQEAYLTLIRKQERTSNLQKNVRMTITNEAVDSLRFSQLTISPSIKTGLTLDELKQRIEEDGWDEKSPIHVVSMPDGETTSLDNRRLCVLKTIRRERPTKSLNVNVILDFHPDKIDGDTYGQIKSTLNKFDDAQDKAIVERELHDLIKNQEIYPDSYGYGVVLRMRSIEQRRRKYLRVDDKFFAQNLYGFSQSPIVWTSKQQQNYTIAARKL